MLDKCRIKYLMQQTIIIREGLMKGSFSQNQTVIKLELYKCSAGVFTDKDQTVSVLYLRAKFNLEGMIKFRTKTFL